MRKRLSDGRIGIRPFEKGDADSLFEAVRESIAEVHPWLPWCHPDYTRAESKAWLLSRRKAWQEEEDFSFAVVDAEEGRLLGGCGLNQINHIHLFANLGYWVRSSCAGRGIATAATLLTARFGLEELELKRIEIVAAVGNRASQRVAEKAGARREGILRNRLLLHGDCLDAVLYSLTPEDETAGPESPSITPTI